MIVRSFSITENNMQIETINATISINFSKQNPKTGANVAMSSVDIKRLIDEVTTAYIENSPLNLDVLKNL